MTIEAKLPSRSRSRQISPIVNSICAQAYERGLPNEQLGKILTLLPSHNHLDQGSLTTLIKGLFPAERVSSTFICGIVASLGQGYDKPSTATQGLLLRWIILVYDVLEDLATLQKLYSVLFNLLDMLSIRYYCWPAKSIRVNRLGRISAICLPYLHVDKT